MAEPRIYSNVKSPPRATSDIGFMNWRGTRDGVGFVADWREAAMQEGRCYVVNIGALSTPIVGGGNGTVIDAEQPECVISVPTGTTIRPVRVNVQCKTPLLATDSDIMEMLLAIDRTETIAGGTSTAETALNLQTSNPQSSLCICTSAYTADMTTPSTPVLGIELAHVLITGDVQGTAATTMWTRSELLYEPLVPPIIVGPAALILYWGGTVATSGYGQVSWVEYPSTMYS